MDQDKRYYRKLKRTIKRQGSKRRRQHLKRELVERPEDAPYSEFEFGRDPASPGRRLIGRATFFHPPSDEDCHPAVELKRSQRSPPAS
jgi:hypothetical protein